MDGARYRPLEFTVPHETPSCTDHVTDPLTLDAAVTVASNSCDAPSCVVALVGFSVTEVIATDATVIVAVADSVGLSELVATTWQSPDGTLAGAVYVPAASIVPQIAPSATVQIEVAKACVVGTAPE